MEAQIDSIKKGTKEEAKAVVKMEKNLMKCVKDNIEEQKNVIMTEKEERRQRLQDIFDMLEQDVQLQNKFFDNFEDKAKEKFKNMCDDLENEMENRLTNQDNVLKNLSHFTSTFQETLKLIGKDI